MTAAPNKTQPTDQSVDAFIESIDNDVRRSDARLLLSLFRRVTGEEPAMWGPTIIGFGSYRYRYDSGREGEAPRSGFSPRKANSTLYVIGYHGDAAAKLEETRLLARLGKHRIGKSCLYINRLCDIDIDVLEALVVNSLAAMDARYPR